MASMDQKLDQVFSLMENIVQAGYKIRGSKACELLGYSRYYINTSLSYVKQTRSEDEYSKLLKRYTNIKDQSAGLPFWCGEPVEGLPDAKREPATQPLEPSPSPVVGRKNEDVDALQKIVTLLRGMDIDKQKRIMAAAGVMCGIPRSFFLLDETVPS